MMFNLVVIFSILVLIRADRPDPVFTRGGINIQNNVDDISNENRDANGVIYPNNLDRPFSLGLLGFRKREQNTDTYVANRATEVLLKIIVAEMKKILEEIEPMPFGINSAVILEDAGMKFDVKLGYAVIDSLSTLSVQKIVSEIENNKVEFTFVFPDLKIQKTAYELKGNVNSRTIKTTGDISAKATKFVLGGSLGYQVVDKKVLIKDLKLNYSFKDLKVKATNLNIPLYSTDSVNRLVTNLVTKYLQNNEKNLSKRLADNTQKYFNELLAAFKTGEAI